MSLARFANATWSWDVSALSASPPWHQQQDQRPVQTRNITIQDNTSQIYVAESLRYMYGNDRRDIRLCPWNFTNEKVSATYENNYLKISWGSRHSGSQGGQCERRPKCRPDPQKFLLYKCINNIHINDRKCLYIYCISFGKFVRYISGTSMKKQEIIGNPWFHN